MTENQKQLWDRISQFEFDNAQIQFNFTDRLARENNWTRSYSNEVIEEYKKFIFLCCITTSGVTPSDQVDQAWHLHLTFTQSYWNDFCKDTLGQEIHHNPTKGGEEERRKFNDFYTATLTEYENVFGQKPPKEIWPDNHKRFSDIHFQRINTKQNWIIKKPPLRFRKSAISAFIFLSILIGIQAQTIDTKDNKLIIGIIIVVLIAGIISMIKNKNGSDGSGCSTGCTFGTGCSSHSGCSGDGGCSNGCSGCGGGCGGGCGS